tara:strand:+ start:626 stop:886 length:261 start_codon:yes stop_codon:yes gene_type:complete
LGEEIDHATISQEIDKFHKQDKWEKDNEINYYRNYLYYIIFEEKKYLQSAYEKVTQISDKLDNKDRKILLNCTWPKLIIEEWERVK